MKYYKITETYLYKYTINNNIQKENKYVWECVYISQSEIVHMVD